jgi:hypothetical protein
MSELVNDEASDGSGRPEGEYVDEAAFGGPSMLLGTLRIHGDRAALFAALARAQAGYQAIPRSRTVKVKSDKGDYTFDYAPLEEVLTATLPSLNENGLALLSVMGDPEGENAETELHTLLTHESGAFIHTVERLPHVGKAQERGSQVTYRRRYQTGCLTGTSPEFDDDGNQADGNKVEGMNQKRRTPPPPPAKTHAERIAATSTERVAVAGNGDPIVPKPRIVEAHPHKPPAIEQATAGMSPEQKATSMGPTVFTPEAVPIRSVVNDEPLSEDMAMRLKGEFVRCGWGRAKVEVKLVEICGEGKTRANLTAEDGEKLIAAMAKEASK